MTDTAFPSISIISQASNAALSHQMGTDLSMERWRGNLWLTDIPAWAEFDWIGKALHIGDAVLRVKERITRCKATTANPETGIIDADTLAALNQTYGHPDFGVYAEVIKGGAIAANDKVTVQ